MAKNRKFDEFYTTMETVKEELDKYPIQTFEDKIVYCNCDDPYKSNFVKYFIENFNRFRLKRLIATCYASTETDVPWMLVINRVLDPAGDVFADPANTITVLFGNGDFASDECILILKAADIVVTNPPFSKFRQFFDVLMEHNKDFLILGSLNGVLYKNVYPYVLHGKVRFGYNCAGNKYYLLPKDIEIYSNVIKQRDDGTLECVLRNTRWFTTLYPNDNKKFILTASYDPNVHKKYDNYDAVEVKYLKKIPFDYFDTIGVPLTFMDHYNPDQFEIVSDPDILSTIHKRKFILEGKELYKRLLVRLKH